MDARPHPRRPLVAGALEPAGVGLPRCIESVSARIPGSCRPLPIRPRHAFSQTVDTTSVHFERTGELRLGKRKGGLTGCESGPGPAAPPSVDAALKHIGLAGGSSG